MPKTTGRLEVGRGQAIKQASQKGGGDREAEVDMIYTQESSFPLTLERAKLDVWVEGGPKLGELGLA